MRDKRKSNPGPDFGCHVGDNLRAVLRNVENTAIMDGCVAFKRDPGPLITTPACFALQPWFRERSIHPTTLMQGESQFSSSPSELKKRGYDQALA